MASTIPVGSDVSSGTYRCTNCSYEMSVQSVVSLPPCPKCDGPVGRGKDGKKRQRLTLAADLLVLHPVLRERQPAECAQSMRRHRS